MGLVLAAVGYVAGRLWWRRAHADDSQRVDRLRAMSLPQLAFVASLVGAAWAASVAASAPGALSFAALCSAAYLAGALLALASTPTE